MTTLPVPYQPRLLLEFIEEHKRVPKASEQFGIYFSRYKSGCYKVHTKYLMNNQIIKDAIAKYELDKI